MRALLALLLLAALPAAILGWKEFDNAQEDMKITAEAARQGRVSMGGGLVSASCRRLREVPAPALMSRAFYCSDLASFAHIPPLSVFAPRRGCLRRKSRRRRRSGAPRPPSASLPHGPSHGPHRLPASHPHGPSHGPHQLSACRPHGPSHGPHRLPASRRSLCSPSWPRETT